MDLLARLQQLIERLSAYRWWEVGVEFVLIWVVVYLVVRFVQGTRAAGALKGTLVVLVVATLAAKVLGGGEAFQRLTYLYDRFLAVVAVGLVVIFQPELRRAAVRLGEPFFRATPGDIADIAQEISNAAQYLARARFGAIVVIERQVALRGLVEGGTPIKGALTAELLQTIFFPGSALHDLAVIVRGRTIDAAAVQLPLADPQDMPDSRLGSRHRAAVGVTKDSDALVVVVSEETGSIRLAERGRLSSPLEPGKLREELASRLERSRRSAARRAGESPGASGDEPLAATAADLEQEVRA